MELLSSAIASRISSSLLQIRVGSSVRNSGGSLFQISEIYEHPEYNNETYQYDISVLKLASPLSFSSSVGSVSLAAKEAALPVGENAVVSGWGRLSVNGALATQLQAVVVPIISRESCQESYWQYIVDEGMVCAGYPEGGKDACGVR